MSSSPFGPETTSSPKKSPAKKRNPCLLHSRVLLTVVTELMNGRHGVYLISPISIARGFVLLEGPGLRTQAIFYWLIGDHFKP